MAKEVIYKTKPFHELLEELNLFLLCNFYDGEMKLVLKHLSENSRLIHHNNLENVLSCLNQAVKIERINPYIIYPDTHNRIIIDFLKGEYFRIKWELNKILDLQDFRTISKLYSLLLRDKK